MASPPGLCILAHREDRRSQRAGLGDTTRTVNRSLPIDSPRRRSARGTRLYWWQGIKISHDAANGARAAAARHHHPFLEHPWNQTRAFFIMPGERMIFEAVG